MSDQIEVLKKIWPVLLVFSGALLTLVTVWVNVYVSNIALETLKSDAAKAYVIGLVSSHIEDHGIPEDSAIVSITGKIDKNATGVADNKADIVRVESKAERIAQILMEE